MDISCRLLNSALSLYYGTFKFNKFIINNIQYTHNRSLIKNYYL